MSTVSFLRTILHTSSHPSNSKKQQQQNLFHIFNGLNLIHNSIQFLIHFFSVYLSHLCLLRVENLSVRLYVCSMLLSGVCQRAKNRIQNWASITTTCVQETGTMSLAKIFLSCFLILLCERSPHQCKHTNLAHKHLKQIFWLISPLSLSLSTLSLLLTESQCLITKKKKANHQHWKWGEKHRRREETRKAWNNIEPIDICHVMH